MDLDLDQLELGGAASWDAPASDERVRKYVMYLAASAAGAGRSQIGADVLQGTHTLAVPPETPGSSFTHLVVYTKSALFEQTTPVALELSDSHAQVVQLEMPDFDLDADELGGTLAWLEGGDKELVTQYLVYMAVATDGPLQVASSDLVGLIEPGTESHEVLPETALASYPVWSRSGPEPPLV